MTSITNFLPMITVTQVSYEACQFRSPSYAAPKVTDSPEITISTIYAKWCIGAETNRMYRRGQLNDLQPPNKVTAESSIIFSSIFTS